MFVRDLELKALRGIYDQEKTEPQRIIDLGVEVKLNVHIGKDITLDQIKKDYDAIFMGMGAQAGRPLPVPGADAPNVVTAMAFLRAFNDGRLQHVGKRSGRRLCPQRGTNHNERQRNEGEYFFHNTIV